MKSFQTTHITHVQSCSTLLLYFTSLLHLHLYVLICYSIILCQYVLSFCIPFDLINIISGVNSWKGMSLGFLAAKTRWSLCYWLLSLIDDSKNRFNHCSFDFFLDIGVFTISLQWNAGHILNEAILIYSSNFTICFSQISFVHIKNPNLRNNKWAHRLSTFVS